MKERRIPEAWHLGKWIQLNSHTRRAGLSRVEMHVHPCESEQTTGGKDAWYKPETNQQANVFIHGTSCKRT